jgi:hypothetical protein
MPTTRRQPSGHWCFCDQQLGIRRGRSGCDLSHRDRAQPRMRASGAPRPTAAAAPSRSDRRNRRAAGSGSGRWHARFVSGMTTARATKSARAPRLAVPGIWDAHQPPIVHALLGTSCAIGTPRRHSPRQATSSTGEPPPLEKVIEPRPSAPAAQLPGFRQSVVIELEGRGSIRTRRSRSAREKERRHVLQQVADGDSLVWRRYRGPGSSLTC